jgi:hypothetical protein
MNKYGKRGQSSVNKHMGSNLEMNDDTYKLRRQVIDIIYEAKRNLRTIGADLPRINVRITDNKACEHTLGMGGGQCIWISTKAIKMSQGHLYQVTLHEILHAVGFPHDEKCPLMRPYVKPRAITKATADKHFMKYFAKVN